jgi:hypothetical protein
MRLQRMVFAAIVVASFTFVTAASTVVADSHEHTAAEPSKLVLDHGSKWATDAPLRKYMNEIRAALAAKAEAMHQGALLPDDYQALGSLIEARIFSIVSECELEPAADANFHLIVAELLDNAATMQGKSQAVPGSGADRALRAVNEYGQFFNHPGWQPWR